MYKTAWLFLLMVFLTSCKTEKVSLKEGSRTFYYQQPDLMDPKSQTLVTLTQVEDARCPEDLTCIWSGYVSVNLEFDIRKLKKKQNLKLCFYCPSSKPGENPATATSEIDLEGIKYRLTLQSVKPNPNHKTPPKKEDYEVSIQIERL